PLTVLVVSFCAKHGVVWAETDAAHSVTTNERSRIDMVGTRESGRGRRRTLPTRRRQPVRRAANGPVIAIVTPGFWMLKNSHRPSGENVAPASSDPFLALRASG